MNEATTRGAARRFFRGSAAAIALAGAALALGQAPPAPREPEKPRPTSPPRVEAPSYVAPPASYLAGPEASQLFFYSLPPLYAQPPAMPARGATQKGDPGSEAGVPPVGHVVLIVDPVTAEVTLDGLRLTQRADLSYAVGVIEGSHVVRVAAEGFEPHERRLDVRRGVGMMVTVRLTPSEAKTKTP